MANHETPDQSKPVHHGHNIRRFREVRTLKQDELAKRLGPEWTQKKISQLEATEHVDEELITQVAKALNLSPELIEKFTEDGINQYFTFNDNSHTQSAGGPYNNCAFNPLEKYVETVEKNEKLYQELLKVEREKMALMQQMIEMLQKQADKK